MNRPTYSFDVVQVVVTIVVGSEGVEEIIHEFGHFELLANGVHTAKTVFDNQTDLIGSVGVVWIVFGDFSVNRIQGRLVEFPIEFDVFSGGIIEGNGWCFGTVDVKH